MECFDHFPHSDFDTLRAAHAQLIADIAGMLLTAPLPGSTPARDAPALPTPSRFVKKGFYMCCADCGMAVEFCGCAKRPAPDAPSGDARAESDLNKRVKDCQAR